MEVVVAELHRFANGSFDLVLDWLTLIAMHREGTLEFLFLVIHDTSLATERDARKIFSKTRRASHQTHECAGVTEVTDTEALYVYRRNSQPDKPLAAP